MKTQHFIGLEGEVYQLQEHPIAGGGEGDIYKIINHPNQVAKIFKESRCTNEREEKLRKMVRLHLQEEQLQQVCWPQDVIFTQEGFAGFIMPMLRENKNLNVIYSSNEHNLNFKHRILVAYNLCAAVDTIHSLGQVCGDLNPQNICVNLEMNQRNALQVTLVDVDSYHFLDGSTDTTYRCEVGLSEYIAPEVQNKLTGGLNLKNAPLPTYTRETDLFALAVHIFALLMNGSHPFACAEDKDGQITNKMEQMTSEVRDSVALPQPIDNIKTGFFPFHQKRERITYPLYAPEFDSLPEYIRDLFIHTFESGYHDPKKRASAAEWMTALKQFASEGQLIQCQEGHWYSFHMGYRCPWCAMKIRFAEAMKRAMSGTMTAIPPSNSHSGSGSSVGSGSAVTQAGGTSLGSGTNTNVNTGTMSGGKLQQKGDTRFEVVWGTVQFILMWIVWIVAVSACGSGFSEDYIQSLFFARLFHMFFVGNWDDFFYWLHEYSVGILFIQACFLLVLSGISFGVLRGKTNKLRNHNVLWGVLWSAVCVDAFVSKMHMYNELDLLLLCCAVVTAIFHFRLKYLKSR